MEREKFGTRLGFILVSAGCAIGLGNVWKFPYMCGQYGGAAFILIYLIFLLLLGIPIMVCEFTIGRGSKRSTAKCFDVLGPENTKWHKLSSFGVIGNYLLMMFYTMIGGWMLYYSCLSMSGTFVQASPDKITETFSNMTYDPRVMIFWTVLVCIIGFAICSLGLEKGIEKIMKVMMCALLAIMFVLTVHSLALDGASEGIKFYLVPDFKKMVDYGTGNVIFAALSQAFFTLSIGIGSMMIFGSYLDKERSILGEAVNITLLDTLVALMAGFIIIPACFSYNIEPGAGPGLVFITLPNIFANMPGGHLWCTLFFVFLFFAALSTIVAVFENLISFGMELFGLSRLKSVIINMVLISILSMPCVLGFNILSGMQPLGVGSSIMDLEDFIVSNNLLPLGSLSYVLFCTSKNGWGWDNFIKEANSGKGLKFPPKLYTYVKYGMPLIIVAIYVKGYYDMFSHKDTGTFAGWMLFGFILLSFVCYCSTSKASFNKTSNKI